jgi:UDP-glucose 4-epimerase
VPRWYDLMSNQQPITIFGDGSQTMDMTYVQDVARANVLAAKSSATADFFNVGTVIATSVLEVFGYMKQLFDYNLAPTMERRDVNLVKRRQCSTEKAERVLGFKADFAVREGLKNYVAWREEVAGSRSLVMAANVR